MEALKVKIQSIKDAKKGKGILEGATQADVVKGEDFVIGILENGTVGGQMSLMFCIKLGDDWITAQCTQKHFEALEKIFAGAKERFRK